MNKLIGEISRPPPMPTWILDLTEHHSKEIDTMPEENKTAELPAEKKSASEEEEPL